MSLPATEEDRKRFRKSIAFTTIGIVLMLGLLALAAQYHRHLQLKQSPHDRHGRLISAIGKMERPCPEQNGSTLVFLLAGQSNAGNHAGRRIRTAYPDRVLNFIGGKCYVAASPLLGATGSDGEPWTALGDGLIASGAAEQVILIPVAVSGSRIHQWREGAELNGLLQATLSNLQSRYRVTHVLWHQGESDFLAGTSERDYEDDFRSFVQSLRMRGVTAPVLVSIASRCGISPTWSVDNPIANAQRRLAEPNGKRIYLGVDTDTLLKQSDRIDDCHFSASGQDKVTRAWLELLRDGKQVP